jgi:hypothetical protein
MWKNSGGKADWRLTRPPSSTGFRGFGAFHTAPQTIQGYEAMPMIRKGQLEGLAKRALLAPKRAASNFGRHRAS